MLRLILILLIITSLSLGVAWIADEPGRVVIDWSEYHMETSLLVILAAIAIAALICMIIYSLIWALIRTPRTWLRSRLAKRQALGLAALTEAFAAIATQDIATAKKQIGRAQQYLPHQPLTLMLSAQIARAEGNESQARLYLEQMLKSEGTEFMAMRGLIENARRNHDDNTALKYAEKALAIKPQDSWLITVTIGLYTKEGRTQQALQLLESSARKRYISKDESRRLSAYVLCENARALIRQLRWDFAIAVLEDALRKLPDFVTASALLAEAYLKQHEIKRGLKVISNAWKLSPHPLLSDMLLTFYDEDGEQKNVLKFAEKLARTHPEHRESQMLLARFAMKRHDLGSALTYLQHLLNAHETVRACTLMAELENMRENTEQEAYWLKRAASVDAEPAWTCSDCQHKAELWNLACTNCSSVAALQFK